MLQTPKSRLLLATAATVVALATGPASAAVAVRTFTINSADIVDLYSATFDGALVPCGGAPTQECTFFGGSLPAPRNIAITPAGTGSGSINVNYDTITGEILQVNTLLINLPKITLVVSNPPNPQTTVVVDPADVTAPGLPFIEAGTGTLGRDLNGPNQGPVGGSTGQGTADPDQGPAIGQNAVFQHNDSPNADTPDFAVFSEIVDSCSGPACGLITLDLLTLDGVRYRLEGMIGCKPGGSSLVLKTQTANNSIYRVNFTTTTAATDCDLDGVLNTTDNCPDEPNAGAGQADADTDGRGNICDNCRNLANNTGTGAQCNADADAFGNRCDGDLNQNNATNAQDTVLYRQALGSPNTAPVYNRGDINCNGSVNAQDTTFYRQLLGSPPGPGPSP